MKLVAFLAQYPTVFSQKFVGSTATRCLRNIRNGTLWGDTNQHLDGVVVLGGTECLGSSKKISGLFFNGNLKAVNYYSGFCSKVELEALWHCSYKTFTIRPVEKWG